MGASGARHHRVPGRRGGGARRRARPALPAPAAERQARRAASPATGGADPRGAGARGASVDRRRHARGGAAGAPARRGGRRAQEPVRRRGRDPGSGEDGGTPMSGIARKPLYTADDLAGFEDQRQLGRPGEYPFTRGIHPTMYRGRLWTMRQFAGFGSAQDTNQRYKFLLEHGQTGLSVAFDFPTLMGYDSDHPRAEGEVGKCGVAISSLADMEDLFRGIPLDRVSTSMTINGPAAILFCFYVAAAERQGVPSHKLRGTIQNDILKEYMAQHAWIYLGAPHAGPLRGEDPAVVHDAVPLPDGGRDPDRTATAQQRGAGRLSGARRGAGRDAVAAHQLARRDTCPADRRGGPARAPDPADHRPRDRRAGSHRSAGRLPLRGVAHRPASARGGSAVRRRPIAPREGE